MRARPEHGRERARDERGASSSSSSSGGAARTSSQGLDAFALFCAYHLGITESDGYQFQNVHQVAKRFRTSPGAVKQALQDLRMDPDFILHSAFDLAGAQVDVMNVPEGVSRTALARTLYEAFLAAPRRQRDWARELADDARANETTFGPSRAKGGR